RFWETLVPTLMLHEGESAEIICPYDSIYKSKPKSLCKGKFSLETIRDDRFSFSEEASTGVFTVNITDLREEDSGIYWCGAHVTTKVKNIVEYCFLLFFWSFSLLLLVLVL
uniref:Immunoglobulin V-set domain-containing protein n=1 Tax=Sinocyclocheilus anshuiensis TaxID=1608454 RepID=A0A671NGS1_9TELE